MHSPLHQQVVRPQLRQGRSCPVRHVGVHKLPETWVYGLVLKSCVMLSMEHHKVPTPHDKSCQNYSHAGWYDTRSLPKEEDPVCLLLVWDKVLELLIRKNEAVLCHPVELDEKVGGCYHDFVS